MSEQLQPALLATVVSRLTSKAHKRIGKVRRGVGGAKSVGVVKIVLTARREVAAYKRGEVALRIKAVIPTVSIRRNVTRQYPARPRSRHGGQVAACADLGNGERAVVEEKGLRTAVRRVHRFPAPQTVRAIPGSQADNYSSPLLLKVIPTPASCSSGVHPTGLFCRINQTQPLSIQD